MLVPDELLLFVRRTGRAHMSLSHNGRGSTLSCVLKGANMNMHKSVLATMVMVAVFAVDSVFAACNPVGTSCSSCTTYRCNSGYYGTARSASSGCTKCPSNATCAGGNGSTFVCAKGYYKSGSSCADCPNNGTTSGTGATSISSCYIPRGTTGSDSTGTFKYVGNCYY